MSAVTRWADTSEHNGRSVDGSYSLPWHAFRANDGTYRDSLFSRNLNFLQFYTHLVGYIVYSVWPRSIGWSSWEETFATLRDMLGTEHRRRLVLMDDVESWSRPDLYRDFSVDLEARRQAQVAWLNSLRPKWQQTVLLRALFRALDERRVIGYGNRSDLQRLAGGATKVRWRGIILADYTPGVEVPSTFLGWNVLGHQHTNGVYGDFPHGTEPFGNCDMNVAPVGPRRLGLQLGVLRLLKPKPVPLPDTPQPKPVPKHKRKYVVVREGQTLSRIAAAHHTTWQYLARLNNLDDPDKIYVGQRLRIR